MRRRWALRVAVLAVASFVGCAGPAPTTPAVDAAAVSPLPALALAAREAMAAGHAVYRIDPAASRVRVHVGRAGALARLGHAHAVAGVPAGQVDLDARVAELALALEAVQVDAAEDRAALGLGEAPGEAAVAATRRNMLGPVLDAARFPWLQVRATWAGQPTGAVALTVDLDLHGQRRRLVVPAEGSIDAEGLRVVAAFAVRQRDFGITPFAALAGALQVADELRVQVDLRAVRVVDQAAGAGATALPK